MFRSFAVLFFSVVSLNAFAGNGGEGGWTNDPEPYPQPSHGNIWFDCGQINGYSVQVTNDLMMLFSDKNGVASQVKLISRGGLFSKDYATPDGQYVLKARLSNPRITNSSGAILSYCDSCVGVPIEFAQLSSETLLKQLKIHSG